MRGGAREIVRHGFVLILLGLVGGVFCPLMVNYRLGIGAHTLGLMGGLILIALGLARPHMTLSASQAGAVHWLWFIAAYGNWAATMLAGFTGASRLTIVAGAGTTGPPWAEAIVFWAYIVVGVTSLAGTALAVFGMRGNGKAA